MKHSEFLDRVREAIRTNQFSYSTEKTYVSWIERYIDFHHRRYPAEMGGMEVAEFLSYLAVQRKVSASTQNQALNALVFLYRKVLKRPLDPLDFKPARIGRRLPVVLSREETYKVMSHLHGEFHLMASILYGGGLRLMECLNLRVKDIDFGLKEILVRGGKGDHDRRTILPVMIVPQLRRQIEKAKLRLEENMILPGFWGTSMPEAMERKYPNAPRELSWQYVFPSRKPVMDPLTDKLKQHFRHESYLQKAVRCAVRKAQITKKRVLSYLQAFLCHTSPGRRIRHPHRAGVTGP